MAMLERYGRYRIVAELGRGGMGAVYEAVDEVLDRPVALKVLHPLLAAQPGLVARFATEARIAARLDHPNIVPVYDVGTSEGVPFMAMKLVRGGTLQRLLEGGPVAAERTLLLLRDVAAALDHAHGAGIVHRDVKPGNILIGEDERALVGDFGIARALDVTGHTMADAVVGTPAYIAPECVQGREPTARSDIYALGILAYELATGFPPFRGEPLAVLHAQVYESPALNGLPPRLQPVLAKALAKQPEKRFESAGRMVEALAAAEQSTVDSARRAAAATLTDLPRPVLTRPTLFQRLALEKRLPSLRLAAGLGLLASFLIAVPVVGQYAATTANGGSLLSFMLPATPTATPTASPTATPKTSSTPTPTATSTATATPTATPTATVPPSPTASPTATTPGNTTLQEVVNIGAGRTEEVTIKLRAGDRVSGSFIVSGVTIPGMAADITFRLYGPSGIALNVGKVEQQYRFQFTAPVAGDYRLSFQNPSAFVGRQIALMATYPERR